MKRKDVLIRYYQDWMESGKMRSDGLCNSLQFTFAPLSLFEPSDDEVEALEKRGYDVVYWGSGYKNAKTMSREVRSQNDFTPLRQNILCFLIAMAKG